MTAITNQNIRFMFVSFLSLRPFALNFVLNFRRKAEDNIKARGQFTGARVLHRGEIHGHGGAGLWILNGFVNAVSLIGWLAFDITLSRPFFAAFHFDGKMNVPSASGIENGFDSAKIIFAGRAGQKTAKTLKIFITSGMSIAAMEIDAIGIHLPD